MGLVRGLVFQLGVLLTCDNDGTPPQPVPGAARLLSSAFGRYRLGLFDARRDVTATSVRESLATFDWQNYFEAVATPLDIGTSPEDPAIVRTVGSAMGIQLPQVVAITGDVATAVAANISGAWTVLVTDEPAPPPVWPRAERAPRQVHRLADVILAVNEIGQAP